MSDEGNIVFLGLFALGAGIALLFMGFKWKKQKNLIENTPTSKVRSIAMGRVETYGAALKSTKLLRSPFSGTDCLWCKWTVEEYKKQGKSSSWVTVASGIMNDYFYLKDETGQVLIDSRGAEVDIPIRQEFSKVSQMADFSMDFLKNQNVNVTNWVFAKKMRYREYYLKPNENVYIMGEAGDNPFVEDGTSQSNEHDIMIQKGKNNSFFYISNKSEKELLSKFKWKTIGGLFGGPALIILGLFILFGYFGVL